ncbi:large subunit ribosomal protein L21e [Nematocida sp. AWRm80]|nr:large subunit ribosomal protein L21e [Nematocida sp. AWRm80]
MRSKGYRANTRGKFKKGFKDPKIPQATTILHQYKRGDLVDIKVDSSIHKGMPYSKFLGKTGRVYAVFNTAVGVAIKKKVGNSIVVKQVIARIEHVRPSNCQKDLKAREQYIAEHGVEPPRLQPKGPRPAFTLSLEDNKPVIVKPTIHYGIVH